MNSVRLTWRLLSYRPWLYLLGVCVRILFQTGLLVPGLLLREVFNAISLGSQADFSPWFLLTLFATISLARHSLFAATVWIETTVQQTIGALLRSNLLHSLFRRPGAAALQNSPGEAISRFRDDVEEIMALVTAPQQAAGHIAFAMIATVIMVRINPTITMIIFLPVIVVAAVVQLATARIQRYRTATLIATGSVTSFLGEVFGSVQAIHVASAETHVVQHFRALSESRRRVTLKERLLNEILNSVFQNVISISMGGVLLVAGRRLQDGSFSYGDFSLFWFYLFFVAQLPSQLGQLYARFRQAGVSYNRLTAMVKQESAAALVEYHPVYLDREPPAVLFNAKREEDHLSIVEAQNLTYRYPASERGIEGVNLRIKRGSFTAVTGRIGSGKSTLVRVLLGLLPRDSGAISWNGELVSDPGSFFVPPRTAYTPQVPRLFSATLKENILLGIPEEHADVNRAIQAAVLGPDLKEMEQGVDTVVGPRGAKLSGGQVQRTAAARMFVREPELFVFDDLSSALDVETERTLWEQIFEQGDKTCLVVSNRRAALRRADHIVVLREGRVVDEGSLDELLERCDEVRQFWSGDGVTVDGAVS